MPPHQQPTPRPRPRGGVTQPLRHLDSKAAVARPWLKDNTRQVSVPPYWRNPKDSAHQWPAAPTTVGGVSPSEVATVNYSTINNASYATYSVECPEKPAEKKEPKRRPIPPCPCPEDIAPQPKATRRHPPTNTEEEPIAKDDTEYCEIIKSKLKEQYYRTPAPVQQNLRGRLLAEQTWFELQCKLFLPTPVIHKTTYIEVLQKLELKRDTLARRERKIWKEVGQLFDSLIF